MRKHLLVIILASFVLSGCATFRHNAVPVTVTITHYLEQISSIADKGVTFGVITKAKRQQLSQVVLLPAAKANLVFNDCLLTPSSCSNIPPMIAEIAGTFNSGINVIVAPLPPSSIKDELLAKFQEAYGFVTDQFKKLGGK